MAKLIRRSYDATFKYVASASSIIALLLSIASYVFILLRLKSAEVTEVSPDVLRSFSSVCILSILVFIAFCCAIYYYSKRDTEINKIRNRFDEQESKIINRDVFIKQIATCNHNISHYYRDILFQFDNLIEKYIFQRERNQTLKKEECQYLMEIFDKFLDNILNNVKAFLEVWTRDSCSTCIKICNKVNDQIKVKTFYRDGISFRDRRGNDFSPHEEQITFDIEKDFALKVILNKSYRQTFYVCDDLSNAKSNYFNHNHNRWWEKYNATIVVPIAINLRKRRTIKQFLSGEPSPLMQKEVLGFLCADNFKGRFEQEFVGEFMCGIADILS